jgi:hypothetical protein
MSFMFLVPTNTLYLFIVLILTITPLLNITRIVSLSRIRSRGRFYFEGHVEGGCIPFHRHVIRDNNLSCSSLSNNGVVCDACMQAKAHQLPYQVSTSHASALLDLIFSNVWGPAINSFSGKTYYVCFIDDFSKFT